MSLDISSCAIAYEESFELNLAHRSVIAVCRVQTLAGPLFTRRVAELSVISHGLEARHVHNCMK